MSTVMWLLNNVPVHARMYQCVSRDASLNTITQHTLTKYLSVSPSSSNSRGAQVSRSFLRFINIPFFFPIQVGGGGGGGGGQYCAWCGKHLVILSRDKRQPPFPTLSDIRTYIVFYCYLITYAHNLHSTRHTTLRYRLGRLQLYLYMCACKCQLVTEEGSCRLLKRLNYCFSVLANAMKQSTYHIAVCHSHPHNIHYTHLYTPSTLVPEVC